MISRAGHNRDSGALRMAGETSDARIVSMVEGADSNGSLSEHSAGRIIGFSTNLACVMGFDGYLKQLNANWQRDSLPSVDELLSAPYLDFIHPDDRDETLRRTRTLMSGEAAVADIVNRFRCRDGSYLSLRWEFTADRQEGLVYALAHGVSEWVSDDVDHIGSDATHRLLLDSAADASTVADADEIFTYASPACRELLGYAPEELVGRRVTGLIHPDDRALAGMAHERLAQTPDARTISLRFLRKDGTYAWIESKSKAVVDPATGVLRETRAVLRDVGERKDAQEDIERIERQALTDSLTGLANRTLLADRLDQGLKHLRRNGGYVGVLMLDLDHFKVINDTLGHQVGDAVLLMAAKRLRSMARPDDTVARFGGDEFVVVVVGLGAPENLTTFAERIVGGLRRPYLIGKEEVVTTVSIGIATTSRADELPADLLRQADMALYRAKDRGRDRHEVYGEALQVRARERLDTGRLVRRAISDHRLRIEYQPIVNLATDMADQAEALLRIDDADRGRLLPEHFLAVAEEAGLTPSMDDWVRITALGQLAAWRANPALPSIGRVAVNVTARELASPQFTSRLTSALRESGLQGTDLSIEVTEHVLLQTSHSATTALAELRDLGIQVGLDDFGTGFSALSYLQTFPLDFIKIDRSFIERIGHDSRSPLIVGAMIALAHALGLAVVAEGVEREEQLEILRDFGCDRVQGYLFSRPVPAADFANILSAGWGQSEAPAG